MSRSRRYRESEPRLRDGRSAATDHSNHHEPQLLYVPPLSYSSTGPGQFPSYQMPYWPPMQYPHPMPYYPPPPTMLPTAEPRQHTAAPSASAHRDEGRLWDERYIPERPARVRPADRQSFRGESSHDSDTYDPSRDRDKSIYGRDEVFIGRKVRADTSFDESNTTSDANPEASVYGGVASTPHKRADAVYTAKIFGLSRHGRRETERPVEIIRNQPIEFQIKRLTERRTRLSKDKKQGGEEQFIFEVTRFLASSRRLRSLLRSPPWPITVPTPVGNNDKNSHTTVEAPIGVEADAGSIITIRSEHIINAIERQDATFPGMTRSGDTLIVPEPFCVLLHHRELLLGQTKQEDAPAGVQTDDDHPQANSDSKPQRYGEIEAAHMRKLYDYVDRGYLESVQREKRRWKERGMCTFELLWLLFPPKTLVYEGRSDVSTMRAFQVRSFRLNGLFLEEGGKPGLNPARLSPLESGESAIESIHIVIGYLRHDGREWISCRSNVTILPFTEEKPITSLPIFPASFLDDPGSTLRQALVERGKRYQSLGNRGQVQYHGDCLSGVRRRLDEKAFVDLETYHYEPHLIKQVSDKSKPSGRKDAYTFGATDGSIVEENRLGIPRGLRPSSIDSHRASVGGGSTLASESDGDEEVIELGDARGRAHSLRDLEEEEYIICTHEIMGYILKDREWVKLAVGSISDCIYNENMIDDLQITQDARNLVRALSHKFAIPAEASQQKLNGEVHAYRPWSADFVPGKGGGRIILLHGKPGVGKTSTAECVAELTKRPLLTITCGDLGTNAMSVDQELSRWLRLGTLWNAVLLFDEADVFLEARAHGDIDRNSLVSVFLRTLEYYQGLMFLTTNRIGSFDEAIISRIHVVLHLPNLTDTDRERIWNTSFRKLEKERTDISVNYPLVNYAYHDDEIRKLDWNGREIRNAFNTMIALAEWDAQQHCRYTEDGKVEVRREHLQEVARMSSAFKLYLKSLRAMEHEEYTKSLGLRDDRFRLIKGS